MKNRDNPAQDFSKWFIESFSWGKNTEIELSYSEFTDGNDYLGLFDQFPEPLNFLSFEQRNEVDQQGTEEL